MPDCCYDFLTHSLTPAVAICNFPSPSLLQSNLGRLWHVLISEVMGGMPVAPRFRHGDNGELLARFESLNGPIAAVAVVWPFSHQRV